VYFDGERELFNRERKKRDIERNMDERKKVWVGSRVVSWDRARVPGCPVRVRVGSLERGLV
jgi:hypothetical protein